MSTIGGKGTLPPEARKYLEAGRVTGRKRLKDWKPILEALATLDSVIERRLGRTSTAKSILKTLIVLLLVGALLSMDYDADVARVLFFSALGLAGILGLLTILSRRWRKLNLADDLSITVLPFFELIEEDIDPKGKISLELPLFSPVAMGRKEDEKVNRGLGRDKTVLTTYRSDPMGISIPLVGGPVLSVRIERLYRCLVDIMTTCSRSGKAKVKVKEKWKVWNTITVSFHPGDSNLSPDPGELEKLAAEYKVKRKTKKGEEVCMLTTVLVKKSRGYLASPQVDPSDLLNLVMALFSSLKAS